VTQLPSHTPLTTHGGARRDLRRVASTRAAPAEEDSTFWATTTSSTG
jgi:hypothetical protein